MLFAALSERLASENIKARLFVVGGAAMALAYDRQRSTEDIDALFHPAPELRSIVAELAEEYGLEYDWLNDGAKGFMPNIPETPTTVFESDSVLIQVASPKFLLAMKLLAVRNEQDIDDAVKLYRLAGFTTAEQGIELLEASYPPNLLTPKHNYLTEQIATRANSVRHNPSPQHQQPTVIPQPPNNTGLSI